MNRAFGLCLVGASVVLLAQACGSEDSKKNTPNKFTPDGGENSGGSESTNTGATSGSGVGASAGIGTGGEPITPGGDGGTTGEGGTPPSSDGGTTSEGGSTPTGEGGISGTPGDSCEPGFGNCDADPDCERNFNLVTSCGDCDKVCNSTQATVACESETCVLKSCNAGYGDCSNGADDGCETQLNTDEHCGSCTRNCSALGSTCATDKCNEINLQQALGGGNDSGANRTWAFSPQGLLWLTFNSYSIRRLPLDGSTTQVVWTNGNKTAGVHALLVQGEDVLWSERGTSGDDFTAAVYRKKITDPVDTLPTLEFVPEWKPMYLRQQGNAYYWFSGDYQDGDPGAWIYTRAVGAPLDDHGTKIMTVNQTAHNGVVAFNVTSDALYWITTVAGTGTAYELRTAPLAGAPVTVVPAVAGYPNLAVSNYYGEPSLQVMGDVLYFNRDANDAADGIYKYQAGDAAPTQLVLADNVTGLLVDEEFIYYIRQNIAGVWRAKITGGAGTQISDNGVTRLVGQDEQFIYAISSSCCNTNVYKVIK